MIIATFTTVTTISATPNTTTIILQMLLTGFYFLFIAHIEVDQLTSESVDTMYSLLNLHVIELFGEDNLITRLAHSYDATKNVFRFDFSPQGTVFSNMLANRIKSIYVLLL